MPNPNDNDVVRLADVENAIIDLRGQRVILDRNVAALYGVTTREVNQAVLRNPDKFPPGYIIKCTAEEASRLRSQFLILDGPGRGKYSKYAPTAFTEKGLYMLATILKGQRAVSTTLAIIETFTKLRQFTRDVAAVVAEHTDADKQKTMMERGSELISDLVGSELETSGTETSFELNLFATVKIKHTVKRSRKGAGTSSKS